MDQPNGPEEKAATLLNASMVMLLAVVLAGFALWCVSDYLWGTFALGARFWRDEVGGRFLIPITLLPTAVGLFRFGWRMSRSKSRE